MSFTVIIYRSVIPVICLLFLLAFYSVSHKQSEGSRKHKRKSLRFPSPAFATQKQNFISMVEMMETQREASHVHQTGPSEAEACSGSSVQIQGRAPAAAAVLVDFSTGVQTPSFQPVPISHGQDSFCLSLICRTVHVFPRCHDRVL